MKTKASKIMKSLQTYSYLENRWKNKLEDELKAGFNKVLEKVRSKDPGDVPNWDKLPE